MPGATEPGALAPSRAPTPGHDLLESALAQLGRAAKAINLDPGMHRFLQQPERTLIVALPVTMDDGHLAVFTGYRVQHSTGRGPGKGGIRSTPRSRSKRCKASRCS